VHGCGTKVAFQKRAHDQPWNCSAANDAGIITDTVPSEYTWIRIQDLIQWLSYCASVEGYNLFISVSRRQRCQATVTSIDYTVGSDTSCDPSEDNPTSYCNGPHRPYSTYAFAVCAYGAAHTYTNTFWSDPISKVPCMKTRTPSCKKRMSQKHHSQSRLKGIPPS
jgi:hypothetical protein